MSDTIKNVEEISGVVVITTSGYFNNIAGDAVLEVFNQKMEEGKINFLIDMEDSKVVNSIGVSILIELIENNQPQFFWQHQSEFYLLLCLSLALGL